MVLAGIFLAGIFLIYLLITLSLARVATQNLKI